MFDDERPQGRFPGSYGVKELKGPDTRKRIRITFDLMVRPGDKTDGERSCLTPVER